MVLIRRAVVVVALTTPAGVTLAELPEDDDDQARRRARKREWNRRYRELHPDRVLETKRQSMQRYRARLALEGQRRERDRERAARWREANPEAARERTQEWNRQNPERRRQHQRDYYQRNQEERRRVGREQNARRRRDPELRERQRVYEAERREHRNAQQRQRRADPEARERHNREQNERRRRERRRRELGLPPRSGHRSTINERELNHAAAAAFFRRRRSDQEVRTLRGEGADVRAAAAVAPGAFWEDELERRIKADAAKPRRIGAAVDAFLATREGADVREAVRMDSIARRIRGAGVYPDPLTEARRRALSILAARREAELRAAAVDVGDMAGAGERPQLGIG